MTDNPGPLRADREDLLRFADAHLDATTERMDKAMKPAWEAGNDQAKTLLTLASGALVLSISMIQVVAPRMANAHWGWCVPIAWFFFAATVVLTSTRHGWAGRARSFHARLEGKRAEIRGKVRTLPASADYGLAIDSVLEEVDLGGWKSSATLLTVYLRADESAQREALEQESVTAKTARNG